MRAAKANTLLVRGQAIKVASRHADEVAVVEVLYHCQLSFTCTSWGIDQAHEVVLVAVADAGHGSSTVQTRAVVELSGAPGIVGAIWMSSANSTGEVERVRHSPVAAKAVGANERRATKTSCRISATRVSFTVNAMVLSAKWILILCASYYAIPNAVWRRSDGEWSMHTLRLVKPMCKSKCCEGEKLSTACVTRSEK